MSLCSYQLLSIPHSQPESAFTHVLERLCCGSTFAWPGQVLLQVSLGASSLHFLLICPRAESSVSALGYHTLEVMVADGRGGLGYSSVAQCHNKHVFLTSTQRDMIGLTQICRNQVQGARTWDRSDLTGGYRMGVYRSNRPLPVLSLTSTKHGWSNIQKVTKAVD